VTRYGGRPDVELVVVLDCADLDRSAAFWCAVLGYEADPPDPPDPPGPARYRTLLPPTGGDGLELLLQRVPEAKTAKSRLHLDLRVPDLSAEVARVVALGARRITEEPVREHGWTWHVLADPDDNEFCVLQPPIRPAG
jgi:predicted enzyme related to lactoylglutathione lyase